MVLNLPPPTTQVLGLQMSAPTPSFHAVLRIEPRILCIASQILYQLN